VDRVLELHWEWTQAVLQPDGQNGQVLAVTQVATSTARMAHQQQRHVVVAAEENFQQMTAMCQARAVDDWLHTLAMTAEPGDEAA